MKRQMKLLLLSRLAFPIAATGLLAVAAVVPSHGPKEGYLFITGGQQFIPRFIQMAGGAQARIVVIPTALVKQPATPEQLASYCQDFAGVQCTVLHTTVPMIADTAAFAAPLKTATGVWLVGGRQWRLADAYLGTFTLKEMFALLDRGGVIGGGSAGASIQASFMVRGDSVKDDNTIMIAPGHTTGFGFITNVAIDQHVEARRRQDDLAVVMKAQPELLGLGLDQATSITVHRDEFVNNGPGRVAVWDGKDHDGKGYYYLHPGDKFDLAKRTATLAPASTPAGNSRKEIAVDPKLFDGYVGRYRPTQNVILAVTREGDHLFVQLTGQPKAEIFPEGDRDYFLRVVDAQITFETGSEGRAAGLVLHQNGRDRPFKRIEGESPLPREHKEVAADPKLFDGYAGRYQLGPRAILTVTREGDHLFSQLTGQPKAEIFPEGERDYFLRVVDAQITFETDSQGRATGLVLHQNGRDLPAKRIEGETPLPTKRKAIAVDMKIFDRYVGRYQLAPNFILTVTREGHHFFTQATGQPKIEVFPETERDYFLKDVDAQITFATGNQGRATGLVLHENGRDLPVSRIK
jgi:cyanophycinase